MSDKPRKMNWRQRKFFRLYVRYDGNGTKAAMEAFNFKSERAAAVHACNLIKKHNITMAELMDAHGLTDEFLVDELKEGIEAKEVKVMQHEGNFIYSKPLKNLAMSHKNRETAHKLKGHLSSDVNIALPPDVIIKLSPDHVPISTESESTK